MDDSLTSRQPQEESPPDRGTRAVSLYKQGCNSSQAVLGAFRDELGLSEEHLLGLTAGFGAGIATMQKTCGALLGGLMVLGYRHFDKEALFESRQLLFDANQKLLLDFHKQFGGTECHALLKIDFHKDGGLRRAREKKVFETHCQRYIREVCRLLEEDGASLR